MTEHEVRERVKSHIARTGSLRALAREWKVSPALLSDFITHRRHPGPKILKPLGLKAVRVVSYEPINPAWEAVC